MNTQPSTASTEFGNGLKVISPQHDGVTHINVYSKGNTALGRWCSNFTRTPFTSPFYGSWTSMEGFYYWVSSGLLESHRLALSDLYGLEAKRVGRSFQRVDCDNFFEVLTHGLRCKVAANPKARLALRESHLPFEHYYYYGDYNKPYKVVEPKGSEWLIYGLDMIRRELLLFTDDYFVNQLVNKPVPQESGLGLWGA